MNVRIERPFGLRRQNPRREATPPFAQLRVVQKRRGAFTLIEMILIMALLVIAISFLTPKLSGFFRGRTLDSEARQLMALMHNGQSRAVSRGVPMVLWFDSKAESYGLE